jgi:hypothetical protein
MVTCALSVCFWCVCEGGGALLSPQVGRELLFCFCSTVAGSGWGVGEAGAGRGGGGHVSLS